MKTIKILGILIFILFIAVSTFVAHAQEAAVLSTSDVLPAPALESLENAGGDMQWVWGEITNLDAPANTFTLKYLDYENDQEKEIVLAVDGNTIYENIKSFDEIKIKDTLSIDYKVASDGKNLAKNVSFEKPDALAADAEDAASEAVRSSTSMQQTTAAPVMEQPVAQSETAALEPVSTTAQQTE